MHDSLEIAQQENDTLEKNINWEHEKLSHVEDNYCNAQDKLCDLARWKDKHICKLKDCVLKLQQEI